MEQDVIGNIFPTGGKGGRNTQEKRWYKNAWIPTIADRIAQMVVKINFEQKLKGTFTMIRMGIDPGKSAHDAIDITRKRCWKYDWILEFDIRGLFDNINHELLMKPC